MYNSLVILFCVLSVYGAYAFLREIALAFARKKRIVAAIRVASDLADRIAVAEYYTQKYTCFERQSVLLCDSEPPEDIKTYGIDVYVKFSGKEAL